MGGEPHRWLDGYIANPDNRTPVLLDLENQGHDVWFVYLRGEPYSNVHDEYAYDSEEFWDFTWHELGTKDVPAAV